MQSNTKLFDSINLFFEWNLIRHSYVANLLGTKTLMKLLKTKLYYVITQPYLLKILYSELARRLAFLVKCPLL